MRRLGRGHPCHRAGVAAASFSAFLATGLLAQGAPRPEDDRTAAPPPAVLTSLLIYHQGPVLVRARAVFIFWGPSFQNPASPDYNYAQTLIAFRNQLGMSTAFNVLTEYYQVVGGVKQFIQKTNLGAGTPDWFDTSTPPAAVTDADVQAEIKRYLASHAADSSSVYEVFIPRTSYSDDGTGATSCGGPNVQYCAYHSFFTSGSTAVKYSIEPYPSCSSCQVSGWTDAKVQESLVCHQTRETVTDPQFTGWFDSAGNEADDKCFGFINPGSPACQPEWSNAQRKCVPS